MASAPPLNLPGADGQDGDPLRQLLAAVPGPPEAAPPRPARIPAGVREPATGTDWVRALGRRHRL